MGHFGFSIVGLLYMLMLIIPNILWARNIPGDYDSHGENKILLAFERIGQIFTTATVLCFSDTTPRETNLWLIWLFISALLMLAYELYWIRYFTGDQTLKNFYRPFFGIPLPGATLPVAAFILLGIYGKLLWLIMATLILGIGHIGIHLGHSKDSKRCQ
ncbi:MAG: hypothetical protein LBM60_00145 [Clostridium sp.]|nr:hypothetical protein [Clostridium sp.]